MVRIASAKPTSVRTSEARPACSKTGGGMGDREASPAMPLSPRPRSPNNYCQLAGRLLNAEPEFDHAAFWITKPTWTSAVPTLNLSTVRVVIAAPVCRPFHSRENPHNVGLNAFTARNTTKREAGTKAIVPLRNSIFATAP